MSSCGRAGEPACLPVCWYPSTTKCVTLYVCPSQCPVWFVSEWDGAQRVRVRESGCQRGWEAGSRVSVRWCGGPSV